MEIVVSGIRPTGKLHIGNYFGAVRNFLKMQENHQCYFFIADFHSLTTHPTPTDLHSSVSIVLAEYLAFGLDPDKSVIYLQSDVPEVTELYLYLNMNAYKGELERVSTFKEKAKTQPDNINAGLLTYPTLMAADILIHNADKVPVGKDQEQHLEMTRTFANRFNRLYKTDYFKEPTAFTYNSKLIKVPGLTGTGKMSKSAGESDCIYVGEDADVLKKKIMRAVTDSGPQKPNSKLSQPVANIFSLMELVSEQNVIDSFKNAYADCSIRYGDLKKQLAEDMEKFISPYRERIKDTLENKQLLSRVARQGAERARESASQTIKEVREIIGFKKFY
ncbi:MAG: tryptophan--tRNA ligase [Bacteroidetes bacterium]|nr:tryptophan--tRNA ligase [Bacteroidota bacterium]